MATRVRFGAFEADLSTGELWKSGSRLRLQEQPFQVLAMLLARPGELVTREELRQKLWPADTFVDFDHSLNTAINKLRDALGDSASDPRYIETLARRGYRFVGKIDAATANAAAEPEPTVVVRQRAGEDDLPRAPRGLARGLFALIQFAFLVFYIVALALLDRLAPTHAYLGGKLVSFLEVLVLVTAAVGIAARLYWLACVGFDFSGTGRQFQRVFPGLVFLDLLWALSPLLIWKDIGVGLAFAATAALLFLPFAQRNLIRMAYDVRMAFHAAPRA
jgi:DNA-binding winged helix-turn-helix (wHTH) protein